MWQRHVWQRYITVMAYHECTELAHGVTSHFESWTNTYGTNKNEKRRKEKDNYQINKYDNNGSYSNINNKNEK